MFKSYLLRIIIFGFLFVCRPAYALELGQVIELGQMQTLNGTTFSIPANNNKHTLIQVWASWCPFCRRQNGYLEEFVKRIPKNSMNIITVSIDKNAQIAKNYMTTHGYVFEAAMMSPELKRSIGKVRGVPILIILDKNNKVVYQEIGEIFEEDFVSLERFAK